jgi:hypothetical protein
MKDLTPDQQSKLEAAAEKQYPISKSFNSLLKHYLNQRRIAFKEGATSPIAAELHEKPWISPDTPPEKYKHEMSKDVLTLCGERMIVKCYDYELKRWSGSPHITVTGWQHLPSSSGEAVKMYSEAQMKDFGTRCRADGIKTAMRINAGVSVPKETLIDDLLNQFNKGE